MPRLRHFYGLNHHHVTTSIPQSGIAPISGEARLGGRHHLAHGESRGEKGE
jgi:hypothetical protein